MYNIFDTVIRRGGYDLGGIINKINAYHVEGKLTDEEREQLTAAARGEAAPQLNAAGEVQQLWAAVRALEQRVAALEGGAQGGDAAEENIPAYKAPTGAHDAYYNGSRVVYADKVWLCVAPEGVACVWAPDVMPDYWQVMGDV